jgi:hypothetical protein
MKRKTVNNHFSKKYLKSHQPRWHLQRLSSAFLSVFLMMPISAFCNESDWSIGGYGGQYYDSMPAGILTQGNANFLGQYLIALTASRTVWRSEALPLSLEIDGMVGQQFGLASLSEIGIAPVLRWSSFPWKETLQTDLRFAPLGVSYTTTVSPLERGINGKGSQTLNLLLIEFDFSLPRMKSKEVFVRLHHRCTIYDLLNDYGANGEDFLALGYRYHF